MTNFFGPGSPYLNHPLLTEARTAAEIDQLLKWCSDHGGGVTERVLDVGCGFGRHCVEFARRGFEVTGVDPSPVLLAEARRRAAAEDLDVTFIHADANTAELGGAFDLAICLFTTLGQRRDPDTPSGVGSVLSKISGALAPDATVVIEVPERQRAVKQLVQSEQLGPTLVTRSFDPETSVMTERFVSPTNTHDLAYELFSRDELEEALIAAGLVVTAIYDEGVQSPPHTFMTLVARPCSTS